jgi:hypothetical protein
MCGKFAFEMAAGAVAAGTLDSLAFAAGLRADDDVSTSAILPFERKLCPEVPFIPPSFSSSTTPTTLPLPTLTNIRAVLMPWKMGPALDPFYRAARPGWTHFPGHQETWDAQGIKRPGTPEP